MKKIIIFLVLHTISITACDPVTITCCAELALGSSAEARPVAQMQTPLYMGNVHDLYANNQLKTGCQTVLKNEQPQKTFMGFTAPVRDEDMQLYLKYQKEGDLPQLEQEYEKLKYEAGAMSRWSFERFKIERRRSFIGHILDKGIIQMLHKIRTLSLQEAQALVFELEHPPAAQFEWTQEQLDQQKLFKEQARYLLEQRQDYKRMMQQQRISEPASTISSDSRASLAEQDSIYFANMASNQDQKYVDLVTTTPTDADLLRNYVVADPRKDFATYLQQLHAVLDVLEKKGVIAGETILSLIDGFSDGVVEHAISIGKDPVGYATDFVKGNAELFTQGISFAVMMSPPDGLGVNNREMELYEENIRSFVQQVDAVCKAIPQIHSKDAGKLLGRLTVDYVVFKAGGKGLSALKDFAATHVMEIPVFEKILGHAKSLLEKNPELVTAEGATFKASQVMEETNLLKNTAQKIERACGDLTKASKMAFEAASCVENIFVKNKHLNIGAGSFSKFITNDITLARNWVQQALRSSSAEFLLNPQITDSFKVIGDLGFKVGTRGETRIMAIIKNGIVKNCYPVK